MRAVVQRVRQAGVRVEGKSVAQIDHGLLVFLGVGQGDTEADSEYLCLLYTSALLLFLALILSCLE